MSENADGQRPPELLTVKEVADYLRVSRVTVWRWCQRGTIPAVRIGRVWRIRCDDLWGYRGSLEQIKATPPSMSMKEIAR